MPQLNKSLPATPGAVSVTRQFHHWSDTPDELKFEVLGHVLIHDSPIATYHHSKMYAPKLRQLLVVNSKMYELAMEVHYSSNTFKVHCAETFRPQPRQVGQFLRHLHISIEIPTEPAIRASTSRARHRLETTEWFEDSRKLECDADPILKRFFRLRRAQHTGQEYMVVDKHKNPFFDPLGRLGKSPSHSLVHTWNNHDDRYTSW
jgi:hypothetical protein